MYDHCGRTVAMKCKQKHNGMAECAGLSWSRGVRSLNCAQSESGPDVHEDDVAIAQDRTPGD